MRFRLVLFAIVLFAAPPRSAAQVPTMLTPLESALDIGRPLAELDTLTALYNGGRWSELQLQAQALLSAAAAKAAGSPTGAAIAGALDFRRHHIVVIWIGTDPFGKTMLARVVVHAPASAEPFSADLPGVG